jgi:hypothetical protein
MHLESYKDGKEDKKEHYKRSMQTPSRPISSPILHQKASPRRASAPYTESKYEAKDHNRGSNHLHHGPEREMELKLRIIPLRQNADSLIHNGDLRNLMQRSQRLCQFCPLQCNG